MCNLHEGEARTAAPPVEQKKDAAGQMTGCCPARPPGDASEGEERPGGSGTVRSAKYTNWIGKNKNFCVTCTKIG